MKKYSINDLSKLTGIKNRTIYFYISEGLIDPPHEKGPAAYYTEEHYYRLMLIKKKREKNISLDIIRDEIRNLTDYQLRNIVITEVLKRKDEGINKLSDTIEKYYTKPANVSFVAKKRIDPVNDIPDMNILHDLNKAYISEPSDIIQNNEPENISWNKLIINQNLEILVRSDYYKKYGTQINNTFNKLKEIFPKEEI